MIMLIFILINIITILYICLKYYKSNQIILDENIKNKDSIMIGYINDNGFNNDFDLILAEIIELNIKGYITIEYIEDNFDKYNYNIKQNVPTWSDNLNRYEMLTLNFLFQNKTEITRMELEEKLKNTFSSYNVQFNEVNSLLDKQFKKENIIDEAKQKAFSKKVKIYIIISIILVLLISILGLSKIIEFPLLYILVYILEKAFLTVLLLKIKLYTDTGKNIKDSINNYKTQLKEKEFLINRNTMKDIVLNKEFADSIALHINTQAKEVFIDNKLVQEARKMSKKQAINVLIIFAIIILSGAIVGAITLIIPSNLVFWFYLIIVMTMACIADAVYLLNGKKK